MNSFFQALGRTVPVAIFCLGCSAVVAEDQEPFGSDNVLPAPPVPAEHAPSTPQATDAPEGSGDNSDPLESVNRAIFTFNETLDSYLLKPVAEGYRKVVPDFLDRGITNVYQNLDDVGVFANSLLQLKGTKAASSLSRIMFNTTFGVAGFFDVAGEFGLPKEDEDFGQTLGYWGVGPGPYLMLPFLGPSTVRDAVGRVPDAYAEPMYHVLSGTESVVYTTVKVIDQRADLIAAEGFIIGDRYSFLRNAYLQRREYLVNDGAVEDPFATDEIDDDFEF